MDIFIVIVLCAVGIILILAEIFLIPGITFAAIAGALFSLGGFYYAFTHLGATGGVISVITSGIVFAGSFFYLVKSKALDKIALKTDIQSTVASGDSLNIKEGDEGIALSRLNPIGKVRVGHITMEAKSLDEFIDEDTPIVVLKVSRTQLIVKNK